MKIGIVTNIQARGLNLDATLLQQVLAEIGHESTIIQYDEDHDATYDLVIFLEVLVRQKIALSLALPWLIVNVEFLRPGDLSTIRSSVAKVLCKTHEAYRICSELFGEQAVYTGFASRDRMDEDVPRNPTFLHIAGHSTVKGTSAVIDAWRWKRYGESIGAGLVVIGEFTPEDLPSGVVVMKDLQDVSLKALQNTCKFHVQPSQTEGFGHVLRESMSVNAMLMTTDAPPMNEIECGYLLPATLGRKFNHGQFYDVSAIDIHACAVQMLLDFQGGYTANLRLAWIQENAEFRTRIKSMLTNMRPEKATPRPLASKNIARIAFLGNFGPAESTENLILDALTRALGHEVEPLQENKVTAEQLKRAASLNDMLLWVRTPGYLQIPDDQMEGILKYMKLRGTPSVSVHLDRFWDIPEREKLIGHMPFWKCSHVFTADGGSQERFAVRGVNHVWMKPAMSEIHLHPGRWRPEFDCDVAFVGAKDYHAEYPFRPKLVDFLAKTYGERFHHVTGIRGHELNDVYASARVTVGDAIFSGVPRYWSDRLPESTGRGALLLHPRIAGLDIPVPTYEPQDLADLHAEIQCLLSYDSETRRAIISDCMEHVRKHDTWTVRMAEILRNVLR